MFDLPFDHYYFNLQILCSNNESHSIVNASGMIIRELIFFKVIKVISIKKLSLQ